MNFPAPRPAAQHSVLAKPARAVAFAFAGAIIVGGLLLSSPAANTQGVFTSLVDGIFTATSAVCVTGLTVLDTATHYTLFGKLVILILIQAGGLGLMLIASLLSMLVIGRIGYLTRLSTQRESSAVSGEDVRTAALMIIKLSLAIESVVAAILAIRFGLAYGDDPAGAIWHGAFHAVSAFNNAGFALYSNNLMDFVADPWLCIPISLAIILGGLGFPVLVQLRQHWRNTLK